MKHLGKFFLAIVALSLLSSGISSAVFAATEPISVSTNKEWYGDGSTIIISGAVKEYIPDDPQKGSDVSVTIFAPNGNLAGICQITPSADGSYSCSLRAAAPYFTSEGDYTVKVKWGPQSNDTTLEFGGSSGEAKEPEEQKSTTVEVKEQEQDEEPEEEEESLLPGPGIVSVVLTITLLSKLRRRK